MQRFVDAFFPKIAEFQKPPRHVKWHEVNLAATLPGWKRFEAAQAWLDHHGSPEANNGTQPVAVEQPVAPQPKPAVVRPAAAPAPARPQQSSIEQFLRWKQTRGQ